MSTTTRRPPSRPRRDTAPRRSGKGRGSGAASSRGTRRPEIEVVRSGPTSVTLLVAAVGVLCLLGLVMVYSASSVASVKEGGASWTVVVRQATFMVIGLGAAVVAAKIPLQVWKDRLAVPVLGVALLLQGILASDVVMRAMGKDGLSFAITANGATRWLSLGPVQIQPSDIVKLALVLWLARLLAARDRDIGSTDLLKPVLVVTGVLAALVLAGDDMGTTLLLAVIMLTMLFLAGTPTRQVMTIGLSGVAVATLAIVRLEDFRVRRIAAFLQPDVYREDEGYQLWQSQIGFASGGFWGNGPGNSRAKWGYLPFSDTDFIMAVIGEELGLIGSLIVIGAFAAFMIAGVRIALRSGDSFGRLVAFGIVTWIGVQALINIGVSVGTLPTKGITLPFVSYGGSSLIMCLVAVGVLCSVARAR